MNSDTDVLESTKSELVFRPTFGKWVLVLSGALNFSLALGIPVALSVMFLDWQDSFKVSRAYTAAVHSTCIGILFAGGVIAGYLMNRIGPRMTVLLGAFLSTLGLFLSCFATSIHFLIVTTGIIAGFGFCLLQLPSVPCVSQPFTKYKSLVIAVCVFGSAVLNLGLPSFYKMLVHEYSWRGAYFIISGLALNSFVTGLAMTSNIKKRKAKLIVVNENEDETLQVDDDLSKSLKGVTDDKVERQGDKRKNRDDVNEKTKNIEEISEQALFLQEENKQIKTESQRPREILKCLFVYKIRSSKWKFLCDPLFNLLLLMLTLNLGVVFSFYLLLMDFAKTSGFPDESTGILLILVTLSASLCGRIAVGLLNLLPNLHSFPLICVCGFCGSLSMIALGFVADFAFIITLLVFLGGGLGGIIAIFPKCILDLDTVDTESFPLALGIASTAEGVFDLTITIIIGHMVDQTGSYLLPCTTLGSVGVLVALVLLLSFCYVKSNKN